MEVVNRSAALLSNFEVLGLLRELEADHLTRSKIALDVKNEEVPGNPTGGQGIIEVSENLRTIEVEAIQYLSADYQPTNQQSTNGIAHLLKDLRNYELTKAEKLQVVNLAPKTQVELYVIVEEMEDRLGDSGMNNILELVKASLGEAGDTSAEARQVLLDSSGEPKADGAEWTADYTMNVDDNEFDDTGEGAGIEGDLDVDDD